jgi:hypothetical protein
MNRRGSSGRAMAWEREDSSATEVKEKNALGSAQGYEKAGFAEADPRKFELFL